MTVRWIRLLPFALALVAAIALTAARASAQVAVRGDTVYTMAGEPIRDGIVVIGSDGKIAEVGLASSVRVPRGTRLVRARVVTPGLIDAHTVVGLAGYLNVPHDQMQLERSAPIQPELRAIDAYNPRERLIEWLRKHGITTLHTGHAPGALVSGQTMIVKTRGETVEDAVVKPEAMVAVTFGESALVLDRSPGTRAKAVALLRADLIRARDYLGKQAGPEDKRPARDLRLEMFGRVLNRELPLLITAHRATDIVNALRVAEEFGIRIVLDGASESYLLVDRIKAADVPVILHPTMARPSGEMENMSMETAARLRDAGIRFALQSGYESYVPKTRVVLFEAAIAAARGLTMEQALAAVTIDAARILGIDGRVGSLERGKDGDLALFDGDPFEYTSHVTGVIIEGQVVSETPM
ncbi:MAG TPA: amidohydrolase family protein [Vicinamibacterales bacterium]|nr:amidohydrolase family protein [Vicinamibacterales bacterium]